MSWCLGPGPIGLCAVQWLRNLFKACRIIAVDNVPQRLDPAKEKWVVETADLDKDANVVARIFELNPIVLSL